MFQVSCVKCQKIIGKNDPIAIEAGRVYHLTCQFPKGVPNEVNFVGAGVPVFHHDHLPPGSSD